VLNKRLFHSLILITCLSINSAFAEDFDALASLTLEELLKVQVTTASKSKTSLLDVSASVSVITKYQIKASGWRSLAEVINSQAGFFTFSDHIYDFVVSRGSYQSNDPNSRILLLLNGHSMVESFGYFNGQLATVDLNHVERIEIVRGPGSVLYGTNAMYAVINVITNKEIKQDNHQITLEAGDQGHKKLAYQGGWRLQKGQVSLMASSLERDEYSIYIDEYIGSPHPNGGLIEADTNQRELDNLLLDFQWDSWQLLAYRNHRSKRVPTGIFGGRLENNKTFFSDTNEFLEIKYDKQLTEFSNVSLRTYYDNYEFKGRFFYIVDPSWAIGPPYESEFNLITDSSTGIEALFNTRSSDDLQLVYGIEYKKYANVDFIYRSENDPQQLLNELFHFDPDETITSLFLSLQYDYSNDWSSEVGFRYDDYQSVGGDLSLRASLGYDFSKGERLKFLYGEAFRAPNSWELNGGFYLTGNKNLSPEESESYELIYQRSIEPNWFWNTSIFSYQTSNSIRQSNDGVKFVNTRGVTAKGLESELRYSKKRTSAYISLSYADVSDRELNRRVSFSAKTMVKLGYSKELFNQARLHLEVDWIGDRLLADQSQGKLPSFAVANLTLSNIQLTNSSNISFSIKNLLDKKYQHPSFLPDLASFNVNANYPVYDIPAEGRSILLNWQFHW